MLKWRTPLEGVICDCLTVTRNGQKLDYDGLFPKRSMPGPDQFILIAAGQTISSTFDISAGYDMSESGTYSVALDTYLEYVIGSLKNMHIPGKQEVGTKFSHLSSPVEFLEVTENSVSRRTLGQTARFLEGKNQLPGDGISRILGARKGGILESNNAEAEWRRENSNTAMEPRVIKGTKMQKTATKEVHQETYNKIKSSISDLKTNQERAKTWFGESQVHYAISAFEKMEAILRDDKIVYVFGGKHCDKDTFAYTFHGARKIFLCKSYEKAKKLSDLDTKLGILTHELSHALAKTDDKVYGISACKKLAKKAPRKAARNADNYEYFVETMGVKS